jgi:hypothetical protein
MMPGASFEKESCQFKSHGGARPGAGRPQGSLNKLTRPLREAAAIHSQGCLDVLVDLRDNAGSEQVRLAAAMAILDRAHGKPRQQFDVGTGHSVIVVDRSCGRGVTQDAIPLALPELPSEHE